ncbi:MFS transporter [Anaeroselena agilis]|uniref:MFS transporter n=1 Tax=Anaeroselena agilis TaxID=3063788 RepID=A0ABU3NXM7_9FIRM|nr:MFS transporter [Selenomonadales bacterium 4137-cl]
MSLLPSLFANRQFQIIVIVQMLMVFSNNLLNPVLPVHFQSIGLNESQIGFAMGIVSLGALLLRPWSGMSADVRGSRFTLLVGQFLMWTGFAAYLWVTGFWPLLFVRFYQGVAMSFYGTGAVTFASTVGTRETATAAIAYFSLFTMIGLGAGTSAGPFLYQAVGFTPLIAVSLTAAACAAAVTWFGTKPAPARAGEGRAPFRAVLAAKIVLAPSVCLFASNFTLGTMFTFVPLLALARGIGGYSVFFVSFSLAVVLARLGVRAVNDWFGPVKTSVGASILNAASALLLAAAPSPAVFAVAGVLVGFGFGTIYPTLAGYLVQNVREANKGSALSILSGAGDIGNALGASVLGVVAHAFGFTAVFSAAAAVILVCAFYFHTALVGPARTPTPSA